MVNAAKAKGTAFETLITTYLKQEWSEIIERLTLSGSNDRGDIGNFRLNSGRLIAWELKNRTQIALPAWVREAQTEAENYGAVAGVVCHKRKGKAAAGEQFVTMTLDDFLTILHAAAS
ncbi:hypothetical protein JRC04_05380 [Mycolicibacterium sp. S2-37]|uniref:hypothetical protein n=1 Tax=Mycolicibacterium sp. S2-37 TaxID=2810297 RepID=UPI001A94173A|nr:hypothetical protein [Mycolicibacterium sp. S2-37]MBO0676887.1 hypothetical protein [Mycolicibacterium sp. S2-37]